MLTKTSTFNYWLTPCSPAINPLPSMSPRFPKFPGHSPNVPDISPAKSDKHSGAPSIVKSLCDVTPDLTTPSLSHPYRTANIIGHGRLLLLGIDTDSINHRTRYLDILIWKLGISLIIWCISTSIVLLSTGRNNYPVRRATRDGRFGSKVGQIRPQIGQIRDFFRSDFNTFGSIAKPTIPGMGKNLAKVTRYGKKRESKVKIYTGKLIFKEYRIYYLLWGYFCHILSNMKPLFLNKLYKEPDWLHGEFYTW